MDAEDDQEYISTHGFMPPEALALGLASTRSDYAHAEDFYTTPGGSKEDSGR